MVSLFSLALVATVIFAPGNLALSVAITFSGILSRSTFSSWAQAASASRLVSRTDADRPAILFMGHLLELPAAVIVNARCAAAVVSQSAFYARWLSVR